MTTNRYFDTQSFNNYTDTSNGRFPSSRVQLPVSTGPADVPRDISGRPLAERLQNQDTSVQWLNDPVTGREKFQVTINIDGFHPNEINMRVEGRKLIVYGEHVESKNQSTSKKIIEKSYELPQDVDPASRQTSFAGLNTMQIEFLSRHSNVLYDNGGRSQANVVTSFDPPLRGPSTGFKQERSSSEFTSTRKLGGGTQYDRPPTDFGSQFREERANSSILSNPDQYLPYETLVRGGDNNRRVRFAGADTYGSTSRQEHPSSTHAYDTIGDNYRSNAGPAWSSGWRNDNGTSRVEENTFSETHREVEHRRSSPTGGVRTSREVEHHRSGSPSIGQTLNEDRFRSGLSLGPSSIGRTLNEDRFRSGLSLGPSSIGSQWSPSTARNTEVREFSRRIGEGIDGLGRTGALSLMSPNFNSDAFYRSAFQPQVFTDDRGQKFIEMKLNVSDYQPSEVKVSVDGHDLVVRAEHSEERAPTTKSRSYFYKQVTLPPNTDLRSVKSEMQKNGTLSIRANFLAEQAAIRHN